MIFYGIWIRQFVRRVKSRVASISQQFKLGFEQHMKKTFITLFVIVLAASSVAIAAEVSLGDILLAALPLFVAVKKGNLSEIKRLLDDGVDVNAPNEDGITVLMVAVLVGYNEVKLLLDNGANVNVTNKEDRTALILAAMGYSEVVKLLLDNGANVNHNDENGGTALMIAVGLGKNEVAKVLLDNGANVHDNYEGETVLIIAVSYGYVETTRVLLQYGANPDIKNNGGKSSWDFAKDKPEIYAILEEYRNRIFH